jgi:hypothetical protein
MAVYSVYQYTALHPRFFYVVLPQVLVLDAAGAVWIVCRARSLLANRSRSVNETGRRRAAS